MDNKLAVITGASTGIGLELARIAALEGYDLVLAADEPLTQASLALGGLGTDVQTVEADLATLHGVDAVLAAAQGRPIDLLCANAGRGLGHAFLDQDLADWGRVIDTNVTCTVYLLQKVMRPMAARHAGKVLVTGSIAGFIPGPFNAVYNATKAFIDNFTEALRNELKDAEGITLTTLMPGPTDTEFFNRAGLGDTDVGTREKADPAKVARDGWNALMAGEGSVISGWSNKLQVAAAHVLPASVLAEQHRKMAEPGTGD